MTKDNEEQFFAKACREYNSESTKRCVLTPTQVEEDQIGATTLVYTLPR